MCEIKNKKVPLCEFCKLNLMIDNCCSIDPFQYIHKFHSKLIEDGGQMFGNCICMNIKCFIMNITAEF